jgi:hypothetical protein
MSSSFEASLSFESGFDETVHDAEREEDMSRKTNDDWTGERKVKIQTWDDEGELDDSCCFGTPTVNVGADCIWKLHGGV